MLDEREVKSLIKQIKKHSEKLNKHDLRKALLSGEVRKGDVSFEGDFDELLESITTYDEMEVPQSVRANLRNYQENRYS